MEKTERAGLQVKMDVLLQTAEESCLLGSDAWYGKLRDVVYALYEQKEIPLEMLIKAERRLGQLEMDVRFVPFPVSWTVKMKKKQKETQDILSYHSQAAGCSDKARAKASGGRQPIEECGRTGL